MRIQLANVRQERRVEVSRTGGRGFGGSLPRRTEAGGAGGVPLLSESLKARAEADIDSLDHFVNLGFGHGAHASISVSS